MLPSGQLDNVQFSLEKKMFSTSRNAGWGLWDTGKTGRKGRSGEAEFAIQSGLGDLGVK